MIELPASREAHYTPHGLEIVKRVQHFRHTHCLLFFHYPYIAFFLRLIIIYLIYPLYLYLPYFYVLEVLEV